MPASAQSHTLQTFVTLKLITPNVEVIAERRITLLGSICLKAIIYEQSGLGSKLRRFAIDMFGYDLQDGHLPMDTATLVSTSKITEAFGLNFLKACVEEDCGKAICGSLFTLVQRNFRKRSS